MKNRKTTDEVQACWHFLLFACFLIIISPSSEVLCLCMKMLHHTLIEMIMNVQKWRPVMNGVLFCWQCFIRGQMRRGREYDSEKGVFVVKAWRSSICLKAEVQTTVWVQCNARKLRGMTKADMKTWPDYCAVLSSKPKSHSTSHTASFFPCLPPFFLSRPCGDSCTLF